MLKYYLKQLKNSKKVYLITTSNTLCVITLKFQVNKFLLLVFQYLSSSVFECAHRFDAFFHKLFVLF